MRTPLMCMAAMVVAALVTTVGWAGASSATAGGITNSTSAPNPSATRFGVTIQTTN